MTRQAPPHSRISRPLTTRSRRQLHPPLAHSSAKSTMLHTIQRRTSRKLRGGGTRWGPPGTPTGTPTRPRTFARKPAATATDSVTLRRTYARIGGEHHASEAHTPENCAAGVRDGGPPGTPTGTPTRPRTFARKPAATATDSVTLRRTYARIGGEHHASEAHTVFCRRYPLRCGAESRPPTVKRLCGTYLRQTYGGMGRVSHATESIRAPASRLPAGQCAA